MYQEKVEGTSVLAYKVKQNGGVTVTQTNVFIIPLTTCFSPDSPSSDDS
jgi:hypothetical protein